MLSFCLSIAALQGQVAPKIEDVLAGKNSTVADSIDRWKPIGEFVRQRIEAEHPSDVEQFLKMTNQAHLVGNEQASFGINVAPIHDRHQGYLIWLSATSRANPQQLSRQAVFLYVWEGKRVTCIYLDPTALIKQGFLTEAQGVRHGNEITVGGTNGGIYGESGYGPAVAIGLTKGKAGWKIAETLQFGESGKFDRFLAKQALAFETYPNHSDVLTSPYHSPTFVNGAVLRFNGRRLVMSSWAPIHNRYWVVSEFIAALQRGKRNDALRLVDNPKIVDAAVKAKIGTKYAVWEATLGGRGDDQCIQINAKPGGVWHSVAFWFKGASMKISEMEKYEPKD